MGRIVSKARKSNLRPDRFKLGVNLTQREKIVFVKQGHGM